MNKRIYMKMHLFIGTYNLKSKTNIFPDLDNSYKNNINSILHIPRVFTLFYKKKNNLS